MHGRQRDRCQESGIVSLTDMRRRIAVHELIVQDVCRIRNSYLHGKKDRGDPNGQWERDANLIKEAHAVLDEAITWWLRAKA